MQVREHERVCRCCPARTAFGAENAVTVTHSNLKAHRVLELRVDLSETVAEVKERLYTYNGTSASFMQLTLMDGERVVRAEKRGLACCLAPACCCSLLRLPSCPQTLPPWGSTVWQTA